MTIALIGATAAATIALVWAGQRRWRYVFKPLASAGFLALAVSLEIVDTSYGTWIFIGLVLGAVGDVALLGIGQRSFLTGLGAFLLGHCAYVVAFLGESQQWLVAGILTGITLGVGSWLWLRPHLHGPLRPAVAAYVIMISGMVALALGAAVDRPLGAIGAALFAVSDLTVARDRFVNPGPWNARIGLPIYYASQVLIALSAR